MQLLTDDVENFPVVREDNKLPLTAPQKHVYVFGSLGSNRNSHEAADGGDLSPESFICSFPILRVNVQKSFCCERLLDGSCFFHTNNVQLRRAHDPKLISHPLRSVLFSSDHEI